MKKSQPLFRVIVIALLSVFTLVNVVYVVKLLFPQFRLDEKHYIGDAKNNLLVYQMESEYSDHILLPILEERCVYIAGDAGYYEKFLSMFSGTAERITLSEDAIKQIINQDYDYRHPFFLTVWMDYAFPFNEGYENYPDLSIDLEEISCSLELIAVVDSQNNLYIVNAEGYLNEK